MRGCSSAEAVWVGLRQRQSSRPLEWTDENTIPYSMHYYGMPSFDDSITDVAYTRTDISTTNFGSCLDSLISNNSVSQ